MAYTIYFLLPMIEKKNIYLKGFLRKEIDNKKKETLVIIINEYGKDFYSNNSTVHTNTCEVFGFWGDGDKHACLKNYCNYFILDGEMTSSTFVHNGKLIEHHPMILMYDDSTYSYVKNGTVVEQIFLSGDIIPKNKQNFEPIVTIPSYITSSILLHIICYHINSICWFKSIKWKDKLMEINKINYIIITIVDVIIGLILLEVLTESNTDISSKLMAILEEFVNSLQLLLKWLMGAPAGLKLNNSFNNMLGKYFSYHIQLWGMFLDLTAHKIDVFIYLHKYLSYLGISFQIAMLCDLISIASFHSYCIYVYAARLFNLQISGLTALMRLFFGRKYNPLRGSVDSCEYTNQELFVGTVAFTILVLLLPTTTMYYTVFAFIRLVTLTIQYILVNMIIYMQSLPLYVTSLWLFSSPKVGGILRMQRVRLDHDSPPILKISIVTKPLGDLINTFKQPTVISKPMNFTSLVSNIVTGKKII